MLGLLHPTWNDDPRRLAPPKDLLLARIKASHDIEAEIEGFKPVFDPEVSDALAKL